MADGTNKTHGRFSDIDYIQWLSGEIMGLARHNRAQLGRKPSDDPLTWSGGQITRGEITGDFDVLYRVNGQDRLLSKIIADLHDEAVCANADITITVSAIVKPKGAAHG